MFESLFLEIRKSNVKVRDWKHLPITPIQLR